MVVLFAAVVAVVVAPAPARAATGGGWVPAPSAPVDVPAGVLCDFPMHSEPLVDEVRTRVLATHPDGSPKRQAFVGDLVVRVTNTATGAYVDVNASGSGLVVVQPGGTPTRNSTWYAVGPAGFGFREGGGDHPRGMWVFDGVYTVAFDANSYKRVTIYHGSERNICTEL
ncbi:hypothetical protein [Phytohabitans rumicis]|nr:hypothetical protein [Phytohabitans rumicis]